MDNIVNLKRFVRSPGYFEIEWIEDAIDEIEILRAALKIAHENIEDTAHLVDIGVGREKIMRSLAIKSRHALDALRAVGAIDS